MDELQAALCDAIRERFGESAQADTRLAALGVDSMQMADLDELIERRFGVEVDQDLFEVETVAELADYIRARQHDRR